MTTPNFSNGLYKLYLMLVVDQHVINFIDGLNDILESFRKNDDILKQFNPPSKNDQSLKYNRSLKDGEKPSCSILFETDWPEHTVFGQSNELFNQLVRNAIKQKGLEEPNWNFEVMSVVLDQTPDADISQPNHPMVGRCIKPVGTILPEQFIKTWTYNWTSADNTENGTIEMDPIRCIDYLTLMTTRNDTEFIIYHME
jgi:hypothetical protein